MPDESELGEAGASTQPAHSSAPATSPVAGDVLAGRYRLVRAIGRGGMGSVWEAAHVGLGSVVAVKLIHPVHASDERAQARFGREARAAASLRSPNVVQIFDHGVHEGTPYIAMELLEGESLGQRLARDGALSAAETLAIVEQVCRAAARAHEVGIVHRDLKPDNIFLVSGEPRGLVKVLDFGIAKHDADTTVSASTGVGRLVGTPFYMSPEQLVDSARADAGADLWSIAVIAYECLVGRRPFEGPSLPELAVSVLTLPPPVPSTHASVPPGFDAWFARATARDPAARFADATTLAEALRSALASPAAAPIAPPSRSSTKLLWVAFAGAAGLTVAALAPSWGAREAASATPPATAPEVRATVQDDAPSPTPPVASVAVPLAPPPPPESTARPDPPSVAPDASEAPSPATTPPRRRVASKPARPEEPRGEPSVAPRTVPPKHDISELEP